MSVLMRMLDRLVDGHVMLVCFIVLSMVPLVAPNKTSSIIVYIIEYYQSSAGNAVRTTLTLSRDNCHRALMYLACEWALTLRANSLHACCFKNASAQHTYVTVLALEGFLLRFYNNFSGSLLATRRTIS